MPKQPVLNAGNGHVSDVPAELRASDREQSDLIKFDEVVSAEWSALVALALGLTGSLAAAEDLTQDAMLRLYRRWSQISGYERPGAWLRRVVINLATSRARRLTVEAKALARLGRQRQAEEPALSSDADGFWATIRMLPRRQAQVLALHYGDDRSVPEIAEILRCAEGTVRFHLHDGRQALRDRLDATDDKETLR